MATQQLPVTAAPLAACSVQRHAGTQPSSARPPASRRSGTSTHTCHQQPLPHRRQLPKLVQRGDGDGRHRHADSSALLFWVPKQGVRARLAHLQVGIVGRRSRRWSAARCRRCSGCAVHMQAATAASRPATMTGRPSPRPHLLPAGGPLQAVALGGVGEGNQVIAAAAAAGWLGAVGPAGRRGHRSARQQQAAQQQPSPAAGRLADGLLGCCDCAAPAAAPAVQRGGRRRAGGAAQGSGLQGCVWGDRLAGQIGL